jgi:hypothetical protein
MKPAVADHSRPPALVHGSGQTDWLRSEDDHLFVSAFLAGSFELDQKTVMERIPGTRIVSPLESGHLA